MYVNMAVIEARGEGHKTCRDYSNQKNRSQKGGRASARRVYANPDLRNITAKSNTRLYYVIVFVGTVHFFCQ